MSDIERMISFIGSIASIISLFAVVLTYRTVKRVQAEFLFTARLPALRKTLQERLSHISQLNNDFERSRQAIELELKLCNVDLHNLQSKVHGSSRRVVKNLISTIDTQTKKNYQAYSKDEVWDIYTLLSSLLQEIDHLTKDRKWSQS